MNNSTATAQTAPVSYYDAMLAEILHRIAAAGMTRQDVAAGLGITTNTLHRKLNGESMLMLEDIRQFAVVLECRMSELVAHPGPMSDHHRKITSITTDTKEYAMSDTNSPRMFSDVVQFANDLGMRPSELVHRLSDNSYIPSMSISDEPAGTGGGVDPVRRTFTADPENPNLYWGPEFQGGGCTIATSWLREEDATSMQIETPETMTADDARELAAVLLDAAAVLESAALPSE